MSGIITVTQRIVSCPLTESTVQRMTDIQTRAQCDSV